MEARRGDETEPLVKPKRRFVLGINAADHDVLALLDGALDERAHQLRPDAPPSLIGADVHGVFDAEPVTRPCAKVAIRSKTKEAGVIGRDKDRIGLCAAGGEPLKAIVERGG